MADELAAAIEASDKGKALDLFDAAMGKGSKPWDVHLSLFPPVQRVLNPPYINPHLPKMYRVCREFIPYLKTGEIGPLVRLEIGEYARRSKLEKPPVLKPVKRTVSFDEIEASIGADDRDKTVALFSAFYEREGGKEFARRLLLLGSGYLDQSLGHSVSCTAFILLEMLDRKGQDPLPALFALAHYFCKGRFHTTPEFAAPRGTFSTDGLAQEALRATSTLGFAGIHHTITLYAVERVSHLLTADERQSLLVVWKAFTGRKEIHKVSLREEGAQPTANYGRFFKTFSELEPTVAASSLVALADTEARRRTLGRFLIKAVCDIYDGSYNPHYLTALGAALWAVNRFAGNCEVAANALYQYLDFFFGALKAK